MPQYHAFQFVQFLSKLIFLRENHSLEVYPFPQILSGTLSMTHDLVDGPRVPRQIFWLKCLPDFVYMLLLSIAAADEWKIGI